ncbi:efflux RND transporter permease subunit [Effusibacillus consociatus]|uniref:Efflux RND transporter permease subunit n=1 Tax=Effusibacillus consociatus TaxID=1117041 RepID=A0ABV9Q3W5_9BACL
MTWFTKWAFKNKASVILMVILTLGLGLMSYFILPKEFLPAADNPMVTVTVTGPGFDADSMLQQVTEPIEKAVNSAKGKKNVFSVTGDGYSKIDIGFDSNVDMKDAKTEVQELVNAVKLPEGVSKPYFLQLNTSMIPVGEVSLTFQDGLSRQNMETAENQIVPVFKGIKGVSDVILYGKKNTQVVVKLDKDKMAANKVPMQALLGGLQANNLAVAVGEETLDGKTANLKVVANLNDIKALEDFYVVPQVRLKDLASVEVVKDTKSIARLNGKEAMDIIIQKDVSSNAVKIGEEVKKAIEEVNKEHGPGIQASLLWATSDMVVTSVNTMMQEVLMGAFFATIVILLFLRNLRMTFITIVSIPLSLGLTLFLLSLSGITLNLLTLGAVAAAVGRLVDDSIVVIENIYRKAQQGQISKELILESTKEVAAAITSSTLTTVAVFLPMGLVKSMQELLLPFALTITYSLLSSLIVALTVVPLMSAGLLKKGKLREHRKPERYMRLLAWSLNHKWVPLVMSFVLLVGSIGLYAVMPKAAVDSSNSSFMQVALSYPTETPYEKVKEGALQLEKFIMEQAEVKDVFMMLGTNEEDAKWGQVKSPTLVQYVATMKKDVNADHFAQQVRSQKSKYAGADLSVDVMSMTGGSGSNIHLDLIGKNPKDLIQASNTVMNEVKGIPGVEKVTTNQKELKPVYTIVVNPAKANPQEVAMQIRSLLNPTPIGMMKLDGKDTVVLLDSSLNPTSEEDLSKIEAATREGAVPLSSIAKIERSEKPSTILKKDGQEYVRVTAAVDPKKLSDISKEIAVKTGVLSLPDGVTLKTGGAVELQADQFSELFQTMAASIGVVYLIMVMTFKTLRAPLAILFTLPLAAIGAVLGLLITNTPVDPNSMIGALMLIGIVVTNAIVLLDRVKQNEETMTIREALIEAGATRMRPIMMTAVATIFAMIPLLFGEAEMGSLVSKSLAVVVIGGLSAATLLTLVIIPVVYELLHFRKAKKQRLAQAELVSLSQ